MTKAGTVLKAPYIYAGGKSTVADLVWSRFGNVDVYAEPFMGSGAVLLRRPMDHFDPKHGARLENATDLNFYIPNFWRSVQQFPAEVAAWADYPVSEIDLHARHRYLTRGTDAEKFKRSMVDDPDYCNPRFAGWWCWGMNLWIGGAWCHDAFVDRKQLPYINRPGYGVNAESKPIADHDQRPDINQDGHGTTAGGARRADWNQPPESKRLGVNGNGPKSVAEWDQIPEMDRPRGTTSEGPRPQLGDAYDIGRGTSANFRAGTCDQRRAWLTDWMQRLSDRLCRVRVLYGDWERLVGSDTLLTRGGEKTVGVFLDPPYPAKRKDGKKSRDGDLYATDKHSDLDKLRDRVLAWCRTHGPNPLIRIAVCGYEGDGYEALEAEGWERVEWEANGGYANQHRKNKGKSDNAKRERIWFSPAAQPKPEPSLFDEVEP